MPETLSIARDAAAAHDCYVYPWGVCGPCVRGRILRVFVKPGICFHLLIDVFLFLTYQIPTGMLKWPPLMVHLSVSLILSIFVLYVLEPYY